MCALSYQNISFTFTEKCQAEVFMERDTKRVKEQQIKNFVTFLEILNRISTFAFGGFISNKNKAKWVSQTLALVFYMFLTLLPMVGVNYFCSLKSVMFRLTI